MHAFLQWPCWILAFCSRQRKRPSMRISHCVVVIVQIHAALVGNLAAESFGQPLKYSDGCKRGLVAVDVFNIFLHIDKVYSFGIDLA